MKLFHVVEFYFGPEENLSEIYRGIYSDAPKNLDFYTHEDNAIAIKIYPATINEPEYFDILDGLILKSSAKYIKGIERGYWEYH